MTSDTTTSVASVDLKVIDGIELRGNVNVDDTQLLHNVDASIRRGFPQIHPQPMQTDRVLLVGGGPSLEDTEDELIELYMAGAKIFTLNGAYHWCLKRNLRPSAQIVVDGRPNQGRFFTPVVPNCRYLVASQCDPTTWDAVDDERDNVWIWHAADPDGALKVILDTFYLGRWHGVTGGTTVAMRGLCLLRMLGYYRFDLFGIDSCWSGNSHHAYDQPENSRDKPFPFTAWPSGYRDRSRNFTVSPWMLKQLEDFLQLIRLAGNQFLLNIHGDGLLAYALAEAASLEWSDPTV